MINDICIHCSYSPSVKSPAKECDHSSYPESCEVCRNIQEAIEFHSRGKVQKVVLEIEELRKEGCEAGNEESAKLIQRIAETIIHKFLK